LGARAAPPAACKVFGPGRCCDPAITAHLPREAIYVSCDQSEATFLGEQGSKDACKYFFKAEGGAPEERYVQVYAPPTKEVPPGVARRRSARAPSARTPPPPARRRGPSRSAGTAPGPAARPPPCAPRSRGPRAP